MKLVDATKDRAKPLWRRLQGHTRGAVDRTLASKTPAETWAAALPAVQAAARRAVSAQLQLELRRHGHDPDPDWLEQRERSRRLGEESIAADMSCERCAYLLVVAGVEIGQALRLLDVVDVQLLARAVAYLDVLDAVILDDAEGRVLA